MATDNSKKEKSSIPSKITFGIFRMGERKLKFYIYDGQTVGEFIKIVSKQDKRYRELLLDLKGSLRKNLIVVINNQTIPYEKGLSTPLKGGDHLEILPLVRGG